MVPNQPIVNSRRHKDEDLAEVVLWRLHDFSGLVSAHEKTVKGRMGQPTTQDLRCYAAPSMSQCPNQGWLQTGGMAWLGALRCAMSLPFCLMGSGFLLLPAS